MERRAWGLGDVLHGLETRYRPIPKNLSLDKRLWFWKNGTLWQVIVSAELAELVDALDSGSSVRKDFRVQVPGSAF